MSEVASAPTEHASKEQPANSQPEQTFTQADVDRIVRERIKRERERYADYDDLKVKAEGAKSVEQQLEELRAENAKVQRDALASRIAAQHGITPEDADLFLTGTDADTLTAQAERLAAREAERRKQGNYVPNEGRTPKNPAADEMRQLTRSLFRPQSD